MAQSPKLNKEPHKRHPQKGTLRKMPTKLGGLVNNAVVGSLNIV